MRKPVIAILLGSVLIYSSTLLSAGESFSGRQNRDVCPVSGAPRLASSERWTSPGGFSLDRCLLPSYAVVSSTENQTLRSSDKPTPWIDLKGPYSAYVMWLSVDENNPNKLLCSTTAGGVFASGNGGDSWSAVQDGMYYDWARQISIDPIDGKNVFCASSDYWRPDGGDVYKSINGGLSWASCGLGSGFWGGVHVCRNDPQIVLAGGDSGIWRSSDGGTNWGWVGGSGTILSFTEDPSAPDTIYAGSYGNGIYRSTDRGATWSNISIAGCGNIRVVAVHSQDSGTIYAAGNPVGIFRTTDYGVTWSNVFAFEAWGVTCAPTNGDVMYAVGEGPAFSGTPGVYVSSNGGTNWTTCNLPTDHFYAPFAMRAAVDPTDSDVAYVGLYRAGVFKTTDGGATWFDANKGLKNCFVESIISHPTDPYTIWAGTVQAGIYKTTNGGTNWFHSDAGWMGAETNRAVNAIALDPSDPDHLLLGGGNSGVWQSFDGGGTWSATSLQNYAEIKDVTFAPSDPLQAWAGSTNSSATLGIWKSTDGGTSWLNKQSGVACYSISVHPSDPNRVIATTGTWWMFDPGQVLLTTDGGTSWTTVYTEAMGWIMDSCYSPVNADLAWAVSMDQYVMRSTDSGFTWMNNVGSFTPPGRPFTIAADPHSAQFAFVPLDDDAGFFFTLDTGATFGAYNPGLWLKSLVPLHIGTYPPQLPRVFYTGTMGNGAFGMVVR